MLPAGLAGGDYWIVVKANDGFALPESDLTNNAAIAGPFTVHAPPCADLQPSGVTIPVSTVTAGQDAFVDWVVTNIGDGATSTPYWFDRVYLSKSSTFDGQARAMNPDFQNPMALGPGEAYPVSAQFTLPTDLSGDYYVFVATDAGHKVDECSEDNNTAVSVAMLHVNPPVLPVLSVTNLHVRPADPWPGSAIVVELDAHQYRRVAHDALYA